MISRYEFLYTKSRVDKLEEVISHFEQGFVRNPEYNAEVDFANIEKQEWLPSKTYQTWKVFVGLPNEQKQKLIKEWIDYYRKSGDGVYGRMFFSMKAAFRMKDKKLIRKTAEVAKKETAPYINKPSSIDPNELNILMQPYFMARHTLKKLKEVVEEYKDVYGSKTERAGL